MRNHKQTTDPLGMPPEQKVIEVSLYSFFSDTQYQAKIHDQWHVAENQYGSPGLDWRVEFVELNMLPLSTAHVSTDHNNSVFDFLTEASRFYLDIPWLKPNDDEWLIFSDEYEDLRSKTLTRLKQLERYTRLLSWDEICREAANDKPPLSDLDQEALRLLKQLYHYVVDVIRFYEVIEAKRKTP